MPHRVSELPGLPAGLRWHVFANTALPHPDDAATPGEEAALADQRQILLGERSVFILVGR
jgi:glycogen operon protein